MTIKPSNYNSLSPFKAWVQQALPAIYDDSLSYTDLLARMLKYINMLVENNNALTSDMKNAISYINNYFDNLDVQENIDKKLDEMVEDGTFNALFVKIFGNTIRVDAYTTVEECFKQITDYSEIIFTDNKTYTFEEVILEHNHCIIHGLAKLNGTITVKGDENIFKDLTFVNENYGIILYSGRFNKITNCVFNGNNIGIYGYPIIGNNTTESDSLFHINALNEVSSNRFSNCNYGIYLEYNESTEDKVPYYNRWERFSDWNINNNNFNYCFINSIYIKGIDGCIISNNYFFNEEKSNTKKEIILLDFYADNFMINSNQFYESGYEAIKLTSVRLSNIVNNSFINCGQRKKCGDIFVGKNQDKLLISNNNFNSSCYCSIFLSTENRLTFISSNIFDMQTNGGYYGNDHIDHQIPITGEQDNLRGTTIKIENNYSKDGKYIEFTIDNVTSEFLQRNKTSYRTNKLTFENNSTIDLCTLPPYRTFLLCVTAISSREQGALYNANEGKYLLLASTSNKQECSILSKIGVVGSSSSTAWCNFNFNVSNYKLSATPTESTSGIFEFIIDIIG